MQEAGKNLPDLYMACGDNDFLLGFNVRFHEFLCSRGINHIYEN